MSDKNKTITSLLGKLYDIAAQLIKLGVKVSIQVSFGEAVPPKVDTPSLYPPWNLPTTGPIAVYYGCIPYPPGNSPRLGDNPEITWYTISTTTDDPQGEKK